MSTDATRLVAIRDRRNALLADLRANLTQRKSIRAHLGLANAELEQAIGDLGGMGGLPPEPTADIPMDDVGVATRDTIRDRRRLEIESSAVRALTAAGGQLANKDLAHLMGVSPHGLEGLLRGSARVAKVHDGRIGNEVTTWVLN